MFTKILLEECEMHYCNRDYAELIGVCDRIFEIDPDNQKALGYKSKALELMDRNDEAIELADYAIGLYPENYRYWVIKADALANLEDYENAIECYNKAFEIGGMDDVDSDFMKLHCEACMSLRADELIELEKYAEAFRYYAMNCESSRKDAIRSFISHVRRYTSRQKRLTYHVRPSSESARDKLFDFLKFNGFDVDGDSESVFLIDVIARKCKAFKDCENAISESMFYDKVNHHPKDDIKWEKLYDSDNLLYEGYTLRGKPYGFGKVYFSNGKVYRDGIFDVKGIVQGREYYPSGQLRFKGQWAITYGYGPNAPFMGKCYLPDGEMIYSGKFEIKRGGVGWPMIKKLKGFKIHQKDAPKIEYYRR